MNSREIISSGILELYVLGQTSASETIQVREWKTMYADVAAEIDAIEISLEQYAFANSLKPAAGVKDKLFTALLAGTAESGSIKLYEKAAGSRSKTYKKWQWLAAASFVLFLGSAIAGLLIYNKYRETGNQLAKLNLELRQKENTNLTLQKDIDAITASNSQSIVLNGTDNAPASWAKIFWVKNTGELFVAPSGLPKAPVGMQYQLWAIVDGQPVDAGLLIEDNTGNKYSIQKMKSFGKAEAFAITLEKLGGSASPLGKILVMSKT